MYKNIEQHQQSKKSSTCAASITATTIHSRRSFDTSHLHHHRVLHTMCRQTAGSVTSMLLQSPPISAATVAPPLCWPMATEWACCVLWTSSLTPCVPPLLASWSMWPASLLVRLRAWLEQTTTCLCNPRCCPSPPHRHPALSTFVPPPAHLFALLYSQARAGAYNLLMQHTQQVSMSNVH